MTRGDVSGLGSARALVVDASVALKLVLPEADSDLVAELLQAEADAGTTLLVPHLFWAEVANALWKRTRYRAVRERISPDNAQSSLEELLAAPFRSKPVKQLAGWALDIALAAGVSAYDCVYLALAERHDTRWITADAVVAARLAESIWSERVWLLAVDPN